MAVTLGQICDAVADTLYTATGMTRKESYDELTEGIPAGDLPLLQVYWEDLTIDPSGTADRTTFQAAVRQKTVTVHADLYAAQRSHIGEDMKAVVDAVDALVDVLEVQDTKDYFGRAGIQAWSATVTRAQFDYAGTPYLGARCVITIQVF